MGRGCLERYTYRREYPADFLVKTITTAGTCRFQDRLLYLANALVDQPIGLKEIDDGEWRIWLNGARLFSAPKLAQHLHHALDAFVRVGRDSD